MNSNLLKQLQQSIDIEIRACHEEWQTGLYKRLIKCPSFESARLLVKSMHEIERYLYGERKTPSVRELVLEVRWGLLD